MFLDDSELHDDWSSICHVAIQTCSAQNTTVQNLIKSLIIAKISLNHL